MKKSRILVVDDDSLIRRSVALKLEGEGYEVDLAESCAAALRSAQADPPDLAIVDYRLPDGDGMTLFGQFRELNPDLVCILMTGFGSVENAVEAMRRGAFDFVTKPIELSRLVALIEKGLQTTRLQREARALRAAAEGQSGARAIIGESEPIRRLKRMISRVARSPAATVLVTGESGTGKDLVARALHHDSDRAGRVVNINCSAIPDTLLESELFGHERGAFTDARTRKIGLIEEADNGTLFLDEIGEMSLGLQAKLLRFLEERRFRRVGGTKDIEVDLRIVAATNRDLEQEAEVGNFRSDLLYRLRVVELMVPPLRDRGTDVALLAKFFCERFAKEFATRVDEISPEALRQLQEYTWPGNVRELKNALERAVLLAEGKVLAPSDFPLQGRTPTSDRWPVLLPPGGVNLEELEVGLVEQALERTGGNRTRAGELLGMNRDQIRYRIEKYHLEDQDRAARPAPWSTVDGSEAVEDDEDRAHPEPSRSDASEHVVV